MSGRVREPVQERERPLAASNDERVLVVALLREAEDAARLLVRGLDVFEAPRGPERLRHAVYPSSIMLAMVVGEQVGLLRWNGTQFVVSESQTAYGY